MPRQKDRQKNRQTLFYRTLPATTEDPKIVNKQKFLYHYTVHRIMTCKSLRNTSEFTYYTYVINTYTSLWEKFQD